MNRLNSRGSNGVPIDLSQAPSTFGDPTHFAFEQPRGRNDIEPVIRRMTTTMTEALEQLNKTTVDLLNQQRESIAGDLERITEAYCQLATEHDRLEEVVEALIRMIATDDHDSEAANAVQQFIVRNVNPQQKVEIEQIVNDEVGV